ncbi:chitobiosyldiphosphodolichol beta-mannosyltransferase [Elysia marginata]|uniref:Chitobiosyldiphosphodolichol beta-mannosyltransferase n=1 Tax=Elysia marginata TaxID=1093978 RepID=A0AAV4G2X1_9GAST|nr:chitobiosyldiphosphodolichol beta-mannosyltransferase [Elysia marginata]
MQYHALSFAKEGFRVYLVGYRGSQPHEAILQNENIQLQHVREPPGFLGYFPRLLQYILKVVWQSVMLSWTLLLLPKSSSLLIQNPPSIPTMLVSYLVCFVRHSDLVLDWHNYGHTILSMALRPSHPLVKFSKWYEKRCGRLSTYNLCVTNAMKEDLEKNWNVQSVAVHDRPPDLFTTIPESQQHSLFLRLSQKYPVFGSNLKDCTRFTENDASGHALKLSKRPALIVSSTSWTEDEDFGILLEALTEYDKCEAIDSLPDIVCVITGKGPQKEFYSKKIQEQKWRKVEFCLPWLEAEDYPQLLASADLGVCLHTSSSGLDLPMKVVDMFGCRLPVCAANFKW